jgi:tetratricopeptide (TPR) repeat protein
MTTRAKYHRVAAIMSLLILLALTGCQSDEKQALDYLGSAQKYYADGQYSLAAVEIKNAIRKDSSLAEPYMLQAKIFEKKKEWEAMHAFLATTLQQQPKHIEANIEIAKLYAKGHNFVSAQKHLNKAVKEGASDLEKHLVQGMIFMNSQKLEEAIEQANAALTISPTSIDATILISSLSIRKNNYKEALDATDRALVEHPNSGELLLVKSRVYSMQGNFKQAADHAETLTTLFPAELSYHYLLAALRDRADDKQGAEAALRNATQANPDNSKAKIALAGYISQQDKTQAAIDLLTLYIESDSSNGYEELRLILAELYQKQGQTEQATKVYQDLIKLDNRFRFTAKNKLALISLKDNRQEEALNILNEVLSTDFSNTEALVTRSIIHLAERRTEAAITDLLSAIREEPKSELALMLLSQAYRQNNNSKLEAQTLSKLLRINPAHKEAAVQHSQLLYKEKNYKAAIKNLQAYLKNAEPSSAIQQSLMNALLADNNWQEAKKLAKSIAQTSKQPAYENYTNAIILQLRKQYDASTRELKSLIEKKSFVHQSLKAIAHNYRQLNKTEQGLTYVGSYSKNHPNDLFAVNLLVSELRRDRKFERAERHLANALVNNNDWINGHLQLAKLYAAQAKWEKAIESGLKTLSKHEKNPPLDSLLLLASSYEQAGNFEQSEVFYRKALDRSPNIHSAANNLSLILARDSQNRERIEEAFKIAKRFEQSNQPLFIDTLGWIYFLRGNYQQAVILLEKAVFGAPNEAVIHYHLGATLLKLAEKKKAREHLEKSRELADKNGVFRGYDSAKELLDELT